MGANVGSGQSAHGLTGAQILARLIAIGAGGSVFADNVFEIIGSSDATKIAMFEVDGFTTGTTRTFTLPNASITVAGSASALTSGRVPFATTGGLLTDSAALTWSGTSFATTATGAASFSTAGGYTSTVATGTAPFTATSTTACPNLNASLLLGSTWAIPGSIGATTPAAGAFTTLSATGAVSLTSASSGLTISKTTTTTLTLLSTDAASMTTAGGYTSTVATGTAPFTATSTTVCPNLNAALLNGTTWTAPGAIGGGTPSTGAFTTLSASGAVTFTGTSLTLGSNAGTSETFQFNSAASNQRGFQFQTAGVNLWSVVTSNTESGSDAGCALTYVARTDAGVLIDVPLTLSRAAGTAVTITRPVSLSTASSGLTLAITTGTSLVVSSTAASTTTTSGCATFAGGVGVAGRMCAASILASGLTSGRIPFAGTGGLLGDSAALSFSVPSFASLVVGTDTQSGSSFVTFNNAAGFAKSFLAQTAGVNRWQLSVADNAAESGSNAGSNFSLSAYTDGGVSIDSPMTITRAAAGAVTFARPVSLSTASSGLTIAITTGTSLTVSSTNASAISCSGGYIGAGRVVSSSATAGIGYATGAGGTVTQSTNKATTVVLNAVCGTITLNNGALAGGGNIAFGFTNSAIAATDVVVVYHDSVGTLGAYGFAVASGSGTATIAVRNMTGGSLSEAIVLRFAVIKAVTS